MIEVAGSAGLLVDPLDVDAIGQGLRSMIFDEAAYQSVAQASLENAQRFDWQSSSSLLVAAFEEAIMKRRRKSS